MRLLDTETGQFVEKDPERTNYAILSHTWDTEKREQTYEELREIQRRRIDPEGGAPSSPDSPHDQCRSSPQLPPSQLLSDSSSSMTPLPEALGRFTQSEVEALLRLFGEVYGLTRPTPAPAPSDHPAPAMERQPTEPPQSIWDDPDLSPKIREACAVARKNGYRYIWIDSCCIDKSSSSELSEAINSMYKWYGLTDVCYAYLTDVPPGDDHHAEHSQFRESRWFKRGWTLQELIAPVNVVFLSNDWAPIGSKHALDSLVESVTGIDRRAMLHLDPLDRFSVAQRLSWAARRKTTREEDRAYSLLGIFDINMPTLYGEGDRAFRRLQEQIMQRIPDQSLFAWGNIYLSSSHIRPKNHASDTPLILTATPYTSPSLLNISLHPFRSGGGIRFVQLPASAHPSEIEYTFTPHGIRAEFRMIPLTRDLLSHLIPHTELEFKRKDNSQWYLAILGCTHLEYPEHLVGRVCYIPSSESGVNFMHSGFIMFNRTIAKSGIGLLCADFFLLSSEIIEHFHPHPELKTVYIPHPEPADQLKSLQSRPYTAIKLVLLTETRDALRSRGYEADLRDPDPDHPTTQWLTLSKDEHTITVKFQHTLKYDGILFTVTAEAKMSGSSTSVRLDESGPDSDPAGRRTVSWGDSLVRTWVNRLYRRTIKLSAAGPGTLTVGLGLDFAGTGVYIVRVDV